MKNAALVLTGLVALGVAVAPLAAQTKAPTSAPRGGGSPPAAAPKAAAAKPGTAGTRSSAPIVIDADRMEVYLDDKGERVLRIVSTGNVKIVTEDCRTATARRAEYYDDDQKLLLIGDAKVWQEDNVVTGEEIEFFLADDRSTVKSGPQGRVKSVFYPKRDEEKLGASTPVAKKDAKRPGACG